MSMFPENTADLKDLPTGFTNLLNKLNSKFTPWQQRLLQDRRQALTDSLAGHPPTFAMPATLPLDESLRIALPEFIKDQRNQMTGPASRAELGVKMINSGAPGVMLDLEDSEANYWPLIKLGIENCAVALHGNLSYQDKNGNAVWQNRNSQNVIFVRPRGLHMSQHGVSHEAISASMFDLALLVFQLDPSQMKHPLCIYIPKSESAKEAIWWRKLFVALARAKGQPDDWIKCMALVESHPLAFELAPFIWELRDHLVGLNLGRWDYMASLIHYNLHNPAWVLPDRNTIPHDVPFFQNLRTLLVETCHKWGILAIGGMTALFPDRADPELNARALAVLEADKKNEAVCGMDGAWTGHPDQNAIAVAQFPQPNQLHVRHQMDVYPDLRPVPVGVGQITLAGTRAAIRTTIRYRAGVLAGDGASLLDGYMEDLATDRIYRLMIAQRIEHAIIVPDESGNLVVHTLELVGEMYREELAKLVIELTGAPQRDRHQQFLIFAMLRSFAMVEEGVFDPT